MKKELGIYTVPKKHKIIMIGSAEVSFKGIPLGRCEDIYITSDSTEPIPDTISIIYDEGRYDKCKQSGLSDNISLKIAVLDIDQIYFEKVLQAVTHSMVSGREGAKQLQETFSKLELNPRVDKHVRNCSLRNKLSRPGRIKW